MKNSKTVKFIDQDFQMDFNISLEEKTIWLSVEQMANLFKKDRTAILRHIKKLYESKVVEEGATCAKNAQVRLEGGREVRRETKLYNLDIILLVSHRIGSNRGRLLKEFLDKYLSENAPIENEIITYSNGNVKIAVSVSPKEETVWLTANQISMLFETTIDNIYLHIKNIYKEGEILGSVYEDSSVTDPLLLDDFANRQGSVLKDSLITDTPTLEDFAYTEKPNLNLLTEKEVLTLASDGKQYSTKFYNLDIILAVGYRVKSKKAIQFRRWANTVLKQYLLKGYAIDRTRVSVTNENIKQLENDVFKIKQDIQEIKEKTFIEPIKEKLFFEGQLFDAYEFVISLISIAKEKIIVIDPYFDTKGLIMLSKAKSGVDIIVCISSNSKLSKNDIDVFQKQYQMIKIIKNDCFHDRFIVLDDKTCYSLGASLNGMGHNTFCVTKLEDLFVLKAIIEKI